ncbi:MAG: chorismate mutase [Candidatus Hydrothermarchaeales archaeon]
MRDLRAEMDRIDAEIVELLKKRFRKAELIGEKKRLLHLKVEDKERDKEVLENYERSADGELEEGFIESLVELILKYSKEVQKR